MPIRDATPPSKSIQSRHATAQAPPVVIERVTIDGRSVFVARDDLLAGGTKERGLVPVLHAMALAGLRHFIYASPFCGFAQIALARVARLLGCEATIFCEPAPGESVFHAYSRAAEASGARVILCASLAEAEAKATAYQRTCHDSYKLPLGFAFPEFFAAYERALAAEWARIVAQIESVPEYVLLPVGSGTLLRAFARVLPPSVMIHAIDVNVLAPDDERIAAIARMPRVELHRAPQPFADPSPVLPPFPSNPFYDAKLLPFVTLLAGRTNLWWNVAG